ncbi:MAG TPA: ABC transporter ATP-binding protein [Pseudonocardiaceae bacterium]|nr:ABC transporter ATP-binding protein [Pseudonocardiaceae bacterium]
MTDPAQPRLSLVGPEVSEQPQWAARHLEAGGWQTLRTFPATVVSTVRLVWRSSPWLTLLTVLTECASGAVTTFGLLSTSAVLTQLLSGGPTPARVVAALPAIAAVVAAYTARSGLSAAVGSVQGALIPRVQLTADLELNKAMAEVDLIAFEDADFTDLLRQTGQRGTGAISSTIRLVIGVASSLVSVAGAMVAVALLNPLLAPALLVVAVVDAWSARRAHRLMFRNFLDNAKERRKMTILSRLLTDRDQATERFACTVSPALLAEYEQVSREQLRSSLRMQRSQTLVRLSGQALSGIGTGAAYVVLGLLLYTGNLALALAGTAAIAMRTASSALSSTLNSVNNLYSESFYLGFLRQLHEEAAKRRRPPGSRVITEAPHTISLRGVSFTYPGQTEPALSDLDLTLHAGEVIALVGENGSGKTTLGKLLTGLYLPTEGTLAWNGIDLSTADAKSVHSRIALIAQQPAQWPTTAMVNVRVGRLDAIDPDSSRWRDAVELSSAEEVIDTLPHGKDTVLSRAFTAGQDLSGGQWQRLAIARGIYRDADVLVADEPSAALDAKAEARAFAGLRSATQHNGANRLTVLVTHRLANIREVDRILVLDRGKLIEQGSHAELMARPTHYRELFQLQASAYTEESVVD